MIKTITLALINESGDSLPVEAQSPKRIENDLDIAAADLFSKICLQNNRIEDAEIKLAEKFFFALYLQKYLKEMNKWLPNNK